MIEPNVILLNGASSSGKSTFGRKLQSSLKAPYFYLSSDQFVEANILPKLNRESPDHNNSWNIIRPKFFSAFHKTIKSFTDSGNLVIVEHVIEKNSWLHELVDILKNNSVLYIGIMCPVEEIESRERARGDRYIGEGFSHIQDGIHTWSKYDLEIDTHQETVDNNISTVINSMKNYSRESSIFRNLVK